MIKTAIPLKNSIWELAESFTKSPRHVQIDNEALHILGLQMKEAKLGEMKIDDGKPACITKVQGAVARHLIASSVNYCYWYGAPNIRPFDSSSTKMYDLLDQSWELIAREHLGHWNDEVTNDVIGTFGRALMFERFPLAGKRVVHLSELMQIGVYTFVRNLLNSSGVEPMIEQLALIPGFGSDMFLKRLFLFLHLSQPYVEQLNPVAASEIDVLPVAADYQLPKVLRAIGVLRYVNGLDEAVDTGNLIDAGTLAECEIRASTIIACRRLQEITHLTSRIIDHHLWSRRNEVLGNFHLTITTDY